MDPSQRGRVLVVDDDPTVAEVVTGYLDRAGYTVDRAGDGPTALYLAAEHPPDLVLLDLMLPGMDGLEVCRRLRGTLPATASDSDTSAPGPAATTTVGHGTHRTEPAPAPPPPGPPGGHPREARRQREAHGSTPAHAPLPVIMLTARGDEADRILGLEVGADDYVTKPFSPRELVLRVESVLRRSLSPAHGGSEAGAGSGAGPGAEGQPSAPEGAPDTGRSQELAAAGIRLDPAARRATKDGVELSLTLREFDLLAFFLRHPGRAFSREELMRRVWGWEFGDLSTVTVHVRRLRGKAEDDPAAPSLIQTVWGVGYRFDAVRAGQQA